MFGRVDPSSAAPLFGQIVESVRQAVATGRARPGDRLPSVRELAAELVINPNTIAKAYQALEAEGITVSRKGSGTFIADRKVVVNDEERLRRLDERLESLLAEAVHLGFTAAEVRQRIAEAMKRYRFGKETR
jgi:GntR family transcriptional regulator